ncbi:hypothetical protein OS121_01790 [Mycolicibacterium mucogenicum]|uniref:hypothetical protein n=1 Tax=Mycolicibacterium mucogenicum TaxID=56689 RepID=UPI00226A0253|nr:hypothetical protein [Mycolicibacterium mucogenicum]MCX8553834.1 hypothetical protein [Mycolicibacterium mucogenicum]
MTGVQSNRENIDVPGKTPCDVATATASPSAIARLCGRPVSMSPLLLRAVVYGLAAVQIAQGLRHPANDFVKSYWLIDYHEGFLRRGLAGQTLDLVVGQPTRTATVVAGYAVAAVSIGAVLLVIELLIRKRTQACALLALLIAASPFVLDQLAYHRRPDQLGFTLLVVTVFGITRAEKRPLLFLAAAGSGFAILCLVHEGVALYYLPFAMAVTVLARADISVRPRALTSLLTLCLPSVIVCAFLLTRTPKPGTAQRLRSHSAFTVDGDTMFDYIDKHASQSVLEIRDTSATAIAVMVVMGVALLALHFALVRWRCGTELFIALRRTTNSRAQTLACGALGLGYLATFMLGIDWMRWFCIFGACWLVCTAALALAGPSDKRADNAGLTLPLWTLILLAYLALLQPLSEVLGTKQGAFYPFDLLP